MVLEFARVSALRGTRKVDWCSLSFQLKGQRCSSGCPHPCGFCPHPSTYTAPYALLSEPL